MSESYEWLDEHAHLREGTMEIAREKAMDKRFDEVLREIAYIQLELEQQSTWRWVITLAVGLIFFRIYFPNAF